jgi:hypothetical protein
MSHPEDSDFHCENLKSYRMFYTVKNSFIVNQIQQLIICVCIRACVCVCVCGGGGVDIHVCYFHETDTIIVIL